MELNRSSAPKFGSEVQPEDIVLSLSPLRRTSWSSRRPPEPVLQPPPDWDMEFEWEGDFPDKNSHQLGELDMRPAPDAENNN